MQHAVVPAELLAEIELLLRQVGFVEQLPGEVSGAFNRHDRATYYRQSARASSDLNDDRIDLAGRGRTGERFCTLLSVQSVPGAQTPALIPDE
jgi:hypothetical protein